MFSEGHSGREICEKFNISNTTLAKYKKKYHLKSPFDKKMSEEDVERAMLMAKQGLMDTEIASYFGVSRGEILLLRKQRNIASAFSYDKITKIDNAKFEELFYKGYGDNEVAKALNMSPNGIYSHRVRHGYHRGSFKEAKDNPLTTDNIEILLGILMGDASLSKDNKNSVLKLAHCPKQKDYTSYIAEKLNNLSPHLYYCKSKPDKRTGKCYKSYWCSLPANPAFNELYEHFYYNGKKRIPIELFGNFTWQSLAYLFMDDGWKSKCAGGIATNCFSINDL